MKRICMLFLLCIFSVQANDNKETLLRKLINDSPHTTPNLKKIKSLIKAGVDVKKVDKDHELLSNALSTLCYYIPYSDISRFQDWKEIAILLIKNGANVNQVSPNGLTPLSYVAIGEKNCKFIIAHWQTNLQNSNQIIKYWQEIKDLLIKYGATKIGHLKHYIKKRVAVKQRRIYNTNTD